MKRPIKIPRTELYERVWSRPVLINAQEIGVSARGLMKICKRANIPVPARGYWARVRAGQTLPRVELQHPQQQKFVTVYFWPGKKIEPTSATRKQT